MKSLTPVLLKIIRDQQQGKSGNPSPLLVECSATVKNSIRVPQKNYK